MRITDLLDKRSIYLGAKVSSKEETLDRAVALMAESGKIADVDTYRKGVYAREQEGTTGIGEGIAIPHCKSAAVKQAGLAAMVIPDGVDFDSLDGEPVHLLFLIAAPDTADNVHLDVLSKLSVLLMDGDFTNALKSAKTVDEFLSIIDKAENGDAKQEEIPTISEATKKILAVTGCPTGIAHTYMAAEALEKKAKELGYAIKVETRGSGGAKNVLTAEEIKEADAIIVAADTQVPMDRFHGKKVIICKVADGINKAEQLLTRAAESKETEGKESVGHQIYKHLMNGVSHMLPFVVGGGILIALAFLIDGLLVDLNHVPQYLIDKYGSVADVKSNFGTLTPVAYFLKAQVGGVAFSFMLPILAGFIAMSIADRPGLALGFLGGAIAANGKSGFLGALIAGYVVLLLKKIFSKLPSALEGMVPILLIPVFGLLITGAGMVYVIEPVVGFINTALNNGLKNMSGANIILLGALLGAMMAVDMGGPVNKAAYVFGTAQIAAGNYDIMAAVMIGGMVPPIAIAIASLLFKNKFTEQERKAGPTNFVMGLSFITEGAIPFAAADPLHPSFLHHRFCTGRCTVHGIPLHTDGSSRWNLRIPGCRTRRNVSSRTGSRKYHFRTSARSIKEESSRIIQGHTIEEFYIREKLELEKVQSNMFNTYIQIQIRSI